ncbi:peptidoglycan-binding domain-containing protein [Aureimonas glaciei]|uniref:Peptidoglycan-binding protein n=1 Tax=Aureimonas glaciei TaxID=1776957 RepID=A0A916XU85_9HYPH|nr:peptidoglycan-binding domain-containing protein [Aureimonas glaciei]GGD12294.1 peptidoglycan-binding protein [Aureimonas glaciei]
MLNGSAAMLGAIGRPVVARPVLSGSIAGVAVLFAVVSTNAIYAQPGRHPRPMMTTRALSAEDAAIQSAAAEPTLQPVPLVLEVQEALAAAGHYAGRPDGRPGQATAAAIRAFQTENALRVDGEPSPLLLSQIRQIAAAAPNPSARPEISERMASFEPAAEPGAGRAAADPSATGSTGSTGKAVPAATEALSERELVRRIQSGLANADVAELKADGLVGEQTRAAIRTFEALEGMDVTGQPDQRLLDHLIAIGAVK